VITRRQLLASVPAAALVTWRGPSFVGAQDADATKVAFVYVGPVGDMGWTYAHDLGRLALEEAIPSVETTYIESVPETAADAERVIRQLAQDGNKVIFTTSFGYMDPTITVAEDFPDTVFIHISGYKTAENVGTGFGKIEEPRYVSGWIAGKMSASGSLGYVAAFPIPEVIRGINAFTLGVRAANPAATVKVVWTNTWFDPQAERLAAEALLDGGVDVVAQHQDTAGPSQAAEARGKFAIGYNSDQASAAPKAVLTCPIWNWGAFYTPTVQAVIDGTWVTSQFWGGWQDGIVGLSPISDLVPAEIKTEAETVAAAFQAGEQTIFTIFTGPLNDQTGAEKVAAETAMTAEELLGMTWFIEGVDGEIPAS
jgi:basic membrane protein A